MADDEAPDDAKHQFTYARLRLMRLQIAYAILSVRALSGCRSPQYDFIIRYGTVYDGTGVGGVVQDLAIQGDRIAARGDLSRATGRQEVNASGLAVAPGFIDMLNHSETALIADGRSQGMIRQGVTLVVLSESSMGPINERMKKYQTERQGDIKFDITWNTLGQYLDSLAARGVSTNIASFVSAATVRANEVGLDNRPPTAEGTRPDACRRPPSDGRRGHGPNDGAHLHPGSVCQDGRTRGTREGRFGVRRDVRLAHAE